MAIGCDSLSFTVVGAEPGQVRVTRYPDGTAPPGGTAAFAAHVHEHPLVNYYRETANARPVMISDFLSRQGFHRLNLYCEYFRCLQVEYQIAFGLPSTSPEIIGIALNRADRDFTEYERDLLSVIHLPLATAFQRARQRQRAREATSGALAGLTDREIRVLNLAALGRTNNAIAHALDISPRTVAKHLEHIYRKLDVNSRTSAVFAALTDRP